MRLISGKRIRLFFFLFVVCLPVYVYGEPSDMPLSRSLSSIIRPDEEIIVFPSLAFPSENAKGNWDLEIRGWIFEPEWGSLKRKMLLAALCRALELLDEECDSDLFRARARFFLVDNERGKTPRLQIGNQTVVAEGSGKEGHFRASVRFPQEEFESHQKDAESPWIPIRAVLAQGDLRNFSGAFLPLRIDHIAVISDVDDTVKFSKVTEKKELLRNTFTRPYASVLELLPQFQDWQRQGASFHYVTATPWQLYPALHELLRASGFPEGSFHMKEFRWKDSRFFDLFQAPENYKLPLIDALLRRLPTQKIILVGDSGEKDPEIYGELTRRFSDKQINIVIRELRDAPMSDARIKAAFQSLAPEQWSIVPEKPITASP